MVSSISFLNKKDANTYTEKTKKEAGGRSNDPHKKLTEADKSLSLCKISSFFPSPLLPCATQRREHDLYNPSDLITAKALKKIPILCHNESVPQKDETLVYSQGRVGLLSSHRVN